MTSLAAIVQRVPESAWEPCKGTHGSGQGVSRWCPVVAFGEPRIVLGLSEGGDWLWGDEGAVPTTVHPLDAPPVMGVLPILERPLPMVRSEAARTAARLGLPLTLSDALPVAEIIRAALTIRSDYWVDLAIEWLEVGVERPPLDADIADAARDRRLAQRTRHRLGRLIST